jgi:Tol biopolymer transport system component
MVVDLETGTALAPRIPARGTAFFPVLSREGSKVVLILSTKEARTLPKQAGQAEDEEDSGPDRHEVVLMDLVARTSRRIARLPVGGPFPDLSADGRRVLYGSQDSDRVSWLFLADLETSRLLRIAPHEINAHLHNITDDGTRVLFVHENAVWVIDLSTGTPRRAWAPSPGTRIQMASGSRDGRRVLLKVVEEKTRRHVELRVLDLPEER